MERCEERRRGEVRSEESFAEESVTVLARGKGEKEEVRGCVRAATKRREAVG